MAVTVTGTVLIGGGVSPHDAGKVVSASVQSVRTVFLDGGEYLLAAPDKITIADDGTWSKTVEPVPEDYAYLWRFNYTDGQVARRITTVPASGTVEYAALQDVEEATAPSWARPLWVADVEQIRDDIEAVDVSNAGVIKTAFETPGSVFKATTDATYDTLAAAAEKATAQKLGVKRAALATGAQGSTTAQTITGGTATIRIPIRLPVKPTRFRIKIRNYDSVSQVPGGAATCKGINVGISSLGEYESAQFSGGTSTPVLAVDTAIPTDGSWLTTGWIDAATLTIDPAREYMIAVAFALANEAVQIPRGTGRSFILIGNTTTGLTSATGFTGTGATPFDTQIEYEWFGDQRVGLFVGDSITEGVGGKINDTNPNDPQPLYRSWPSLWAARAHCVAQNLAISGTTAAQWATPTFDRWGRLDITTTVPDFGYIGFGSNDANASTSLATFKTNFKTVLDNMRAKIGTNKPIYVGTVTPRNFDTTKDALRLSYNAWLRTLPWGIAGVIDFDSVMKDPTTPVVMPTEFVNGDNTHPSRAGYNRMAMSVPALPGL